MEFLLLYIDQKYGVFTTSLPQKVNAMTIPNTSTYHSHQYRNQSSGDL